MKIIICDECGKRISVKEETISGRLETFIAENDESLAIHTILITESQHFCSGGECLIKYISKKLVYNQEKS